MIGFLIGVTVGLLLYNYLGWKLLQKVYGGGWQLKSVVRRLGPDSFAHLKNVVEEEAKRRAKL